MTRIHMARSVRRFLGLACIAALLPVPLAWAGVDPEPFRTGLFGVAAGQSVRISVLNAGDARGVINPCVRIWGAAGRLLFEREAGRLKGGLGTFVDFQPVPNDGAPPPTGARVPGVPPAPLASRVQVRVEVEIGPVPDDGRPACQPVPEDGRPAGAPIPDDGRPRPDDVALCRVLPTVIPTLEVFDTATGRTVYTMPFAKVAFNPQPEPPEPIARR